MDITKNVTFITINFKTPILLQDCVLSVLPHYPNVPHILIDNGGCEESLAVIHKFDKLDHITTLENPENKYHGPAMHQGFKLATTSYVFTLDSDTKVIESGFLELMLSEFELDPLLFAMGWLRYVGPQGVAGPHQELKKGMEYVHPYAALYNRETYFKLHPFIPSGAPSTKLMWSAKKKGYHLRSFPIEKYIWHKVAGTRGMFEGLCRVGTDTKPGRWRKHRI